MNYQYRYGTTTTQATKTLYADGGMSRYYQGLLAALFQGPISRFGDTAANAGILALLQSNSIMKKLPTVIKTVFASVAAALFRMTLTPIDTVKTTMQTQGKPGLKILRTRVSFDGAVRCSKANIEYVFRLKGTALDRCGTVRSLPPLPRSLATIRYVALHTLLQHGADSASCSGSRHTTGSAQ